MEELPKRKQIRAKGYDYSEAGAYFVTICTEKRKCILSEIVTGENIYDTVGAIHESPVVRLTQYGEIVDKFIKIIPNRFNVKIHKYVIMPNHIHMIIEIESDESLRSIHESTLQKRALIPKIIGYMKMNSSKEIHFHDPDLSVWQRSYHDHIIRNEKDYLEIYQYIESNPARWAEDKYYQS